MIVKNEEDTLKRCLDSVKNIVDEIIIVDTGSTDNTKAIALNYTDKVYDFKWINDFSKARNYSFSKATMDYILWLDADDVITYENNKKLAKLKDNIKSSVDIIMLKYSVSFDENDNAIMTYYRERIIKNNKQYFWQGQIHEVIIPTGNIVYKDIVIEHRKIHPGDPKRNLNIFRDMQKNNIEFDARQQFYFARELYYNKLYDEAINEFNKFLNNNNGWIENKINACIDLSKCYNLANKKEKILPTLFKSFKYDTPRAEICCEIGNYFYNLNNYNLAIYWYETASKIKPNIKSGGFYLLDCYNYIPYIQLCVCYYKLGNIKNAIKYNEKAGKIKPNDKIYLLNKDFFDNIPQTIKLN